MVKRLINSDELWKKFQFYSLTVLVGLMITGIGIMTSDHFSLKDHLNYSKEKNTQQDFRMEQMMNFMLELSATESNNTTEIKGIKEQRKEDKEQIYKEIEMLRNKVYRGGGGISFKSNYSTGY